MMHRVMIEFVVDLPNPDVARDVETRVGREHHDRLCDVLQTAIGFEPLQTPGRRGIFVGTEPVTWNAAEQEWIGTDDGPDDE